MHDANPHWFLGSDRASPKTSGTSRTDGGDGGGWSGRLFFLFRKVASVVQPKELQDARNDLKAKYQMFRSQA